MKAESKIMSRLIGYWMRREYWNLKNLAMILERSWIQKKKRKRARRVITIRIISFILRRHYIKKIMEERNNIASLIQMKVDLVSKDGVKTKSLKYIEPDLSYV